MSQGGPGSFKKLFSKKYNEDSVEEEILSIVEEGHEQGIIEDNEVEMISNIFEFSDKDARDIMTPKQRMIVLASTLTVEEALNEAIENNFSRYPVYEEDIDNICGVVHIKDLIIAYIYTPQKTVADIKDEAMFIHPTFNISKLLQKMQKEKVHMAVVLDEYGQTEGLVSMEDIIEEIVGNIFDEYDEVEEESIKRLSDDSLKVDGETKISELSDCLGIEFPDEDYETVNGFLLYKLGRLPVEGSDNSVRYKGYLFDTIDICDKMIKSVRIKKIDEQINEDKE